MLLLALVLVVAYAANPAPTHPKWPSSFSTSAIFHESGRRRPGKYLLFFLMNVFM